MPDSVPIFPPNSKPGDAPAVWVQPDEVETMIGRGWLTEPLKRKPSAAARAAKKDDKS